MKRISVALVDLGDQLPISLSYLVKKLNRLQETYEFTDEISIPSLGEPDESYKWYHMEHLLDVVQGHRCASCYDYVIGLTHVQITCREPDPNDEEKDYFSCGDYRKCAVISMNDNILKYRSEVTDVYQYAAFLAIAELLCARASANLCHTVTRGCLFDDCCDRKNIRRAILKGVICVDCESALRRACVGDRELASVRCILKWCKRRTGSGALLVRVARHSLTSLSIGTIIGWLSSVYVSEKNYTIAVLLALLVPCGVTIFYIARDGYNPPP